MDTQSQKGILGVKGCFVLLSGCAEPSTVPNYPFVIYTDVFGVGLGMVLEQDIPNGERPIFLPQS